MHVKEERIDSDTGGDTQEGLQIGEDGKWDLVFLKVKVLSRSPLGHCTS